MGGKLRFGDPGVRLFETSENGLDYFTSVPARFQPQDGNGVSRRTTTCLAAMNCHSVLRSSRAVCRSRTSNSTQRDAAKLGVNAGTRVSFSYDGNTVTLPVEIAEGADGRGRWATDGYVRHCSGAGWRAS